MRSKRKNITVLSKYQNVSKLRGQTVQGVSLTTTLKKHLNFARQLVLASALTILDLYSTTMGFFLTALYRDHMRTY